jgi:Family of unknown function (DUF5681)
MADDCESEVGYRKPPKASQFQKGKSGNPRGRPRENPGIVSVFKKVSKQVVRTNGPNGQQRMTKLEAGITQLVNKAAAGDLKAMKVVMQMASRFPELVTESLPIPTSVVITIVDPNDSNATGQG